MDTIEHHPSPVALDDVDGRVEIGANDTVVLRWAGSGFCKDLRRRNPKPRPSGRPVVPPPGELKEPAQLGDGDHQPRKALEAPQLLAVPFDGQQPLNERRRDLIEEPEGLSAGHHLIERRVSS